MAPQPTAAAGENMLQNPSLEEATDVEDIPNCWGTGNGGGVNTATWSRTHEAHSGEWAEQVEISSYTSGDEKLVSRQDTGSCAPTAKPGHTYNASAWYESNQPVHLVAYYYIPEGTEKGWHFWAQSNPFAASSTYTQAKWTTPAFPANATLISVGASLRAVGKMTVDDFSLSDSDTIPPVVKVTLPLAAANISGTTEIGVEATSSDGEITQVECLVDGHVVGVSLIAPYSCEWNSTTVSEGSHTISARAEDWAGNVSESPGVAINVSNGPPPDTTPPNVKLLSPLAGADLRGSVSLSAEASDNVGVARVEFLVDGQVIETDLLPPYTATWNTTTVSNGLHVISARAVDEAGNIAEEPHEVLVDNTPPISSASSPAYSNSASWTVSYTASDNAGGSGLAEVALYAKGPGQSAYTQVASTTSESTSGSFNYTASAGEGTYSFYTVAKDHAGNLQATPSEPTTTTLLDQQPPTSSASSPAHSTAASWTVSYTASDNTGGSGLAEVALYAKGPGQSSYTRAASTTSASAAGSFNYTASAGEGTYSFYTLAKDHAGNVQVAPSTPNVTTAFGVPHSSASSPTYSRTSTWTVTYSATDTEGGGGIAELALYAKGPGQSTYTKATSTTSGATSGSFSYTGTAGEGSYSFYTVATDKAGYQQPAPAEPNTSTFLDQRVPTSTASAPAYAKGTTWTVSYTASDNTGGSGLAEVALYAEGPGQSSYTQVASTTSASASGSFNYTASAGEGTYSFYTLAKDRAGNVQGVPARAQSRTLLDEQPPTSSASSAAYSKSKSWAVSYTASDNAGGSGLDEVALYAEGPGQSSYAKVASNTSGVGAGSFNYTASAGEGTYSFYTLATDLAGNVQATPAEPNTTTVLDMLAPSAVSVSTGNALGEPVGVAQPGDSVTFTYSETMKPSSILAGWTGTSTPVRVQLSRTTGNTSLNVYSSNGATLLPLANPLSLGGIYTTTATAVLSATMAQSGPSITVTLGPLLSGTISPVPVVGGTMVWTPRAGATDLAGNACLTTSVSAPGPAF